MTRAAILRAKSKSRLNEMAAAKAAPRNKRAPAKKSAPKKRRK